MSISPAIKAFLIRQAKVAVSTALPILLAAHFLDPKQFELHHWAGIWHTMELSAAQVASAEMTHVVLPLLAKAFIFLSTWSQSPTNGTTETTRTDVTAATNSDPKP